MLSGVIGLEGDIRRLPNRSGPISGGGVSYIGRKKYIFLKLTNIILEELLNLVNRNIKGY